MVADSRKELATYGEHERAQALARYQQLRPFLEDGVSLAQIAKDQQLNLRTARRWVQQYRTHGLAGLCRKGRSDKNARRLSLEVQQLAEGLALQKPPLSVAAIHRKTVAFARERGAKPPSYSTVFNLVARIEPALVTMAHGGSKAYDETFDLVHRTQAIAPNAIWQADHTQLDIWIRDERKQPKRPWLTIVIDDYSRAIAGYYLSLTAPSAMQTSLALRQAIWRKSQSDWHICGIPQVLYTDHGSDFTSHHIEQVTADLKIQMVFSAVARPRGRGKIERFFRTLNQVLLSRLPGAMPSNANTARLTLPQLGCELEGYLLREYHVTPHSSTGQPPQARWEAGGFLPHMPASLEQLDLLLLTVTKTRHVQQDGVHFQGMRYLSPTLAAYVGEQVLLRYDPRDMAEVRLFHNDRFLCRAICQELAGETITLREIVKARRQRSQQLRQTLQERQRAVDSLIEARHWEGPAEERSAKKPPGKPAVPKLKRYIND